MLIRLILSNLVLLAVTTVLARGTPSPVTSFLHGVSGCLVLCLVVLVLLLIWVPPT